MTEYPSDFDESGLPPITKSELRRVGIVLRDKHVRHWLQRGELLMDAYLTRHAMLDQHCNRLFEEDGA